MSEKIHDHIVDLINSMSKSERRYFKIYASKHVIGEGNSYEALFDFIAKEQTFSLSDIQNNFMGHSMLNNFTITLHRLFDHLLKSLEAYHASTSVNLELRHLLNYADILFSKALYSTCSKICNRIEKQAQENENDIALLEVNALRKKLLEIKNYENSDSSDIKELTTKDSKSLETLSNISKLWHTKSRILQKLNSQGGASNEQEKELFEQLNEGVIEPKSGRFEEQYLFYHSKAAYAFSVAKHRESLEFVNANLTLFENNPIKKINDLNRYLSLLSNAIYLNQIMQRFDEVQYWLKALIALRNNIRPEINEDLKIKVFNTSYTTELMINNQLGNFDENIEIIPKLLSQLNNYAGKISGVREMYFYHLFAISYLAVGQVKTAQRHLQTILNSKNAKNSQEILSATKIIYLISVLESNDEQLFPYTFKATKRHLINTGKFNDFEKLLFKYLDKIYQASSIWDKADLYSDLVVHIENQQNKFKNNPLFHIFPYKCWAESNFKTTPMTACVKNQFSVLSK